jgi:hypothetical protein
MTAVEKSVENGRFPQRKKKKQKERKKAPVVPWKTLRVSHSPTGTAASDGKTSCI